MVFICFVMGWWAGGLRVPAHGVRELPAAGGLARPPPLPPHPLAEVRAHRGLHQPHRGPEHRYIHYTQITTDIYLCSGRDSKQFCESGRIYSGSGYDSSEFLIQILSMLHMLAYLRINKKRIHQLSATWQSCVYRY